jgi:hypothetical protein
LTKEPRSKIKSIGSPAVSPKLIEMANVPARPMTLAQTKEFREGGTREARQGRAGVRESAGLSRSEALLARRGQAALRVKQASMPARDFRKGVRRTPKR